MRLAAVGRWDQIVKAIEERFGGLADALNARANAAQPGRAPPELIQESAASLTPLGVSPSRIDPRSLSSRSRLNC